MKILENLHAFVWMNPAANNCNTYFITGQKNILIDPGHYHLFGHVRDELARLGLGIDDMDIVIITHSHPDHIEGIRIFKDRPTMTAIGRIEMDRIKRAGLQYAQALGIQDFEPDILLQEGELEIGDTSLQVIHTPGHSPGSICLYWPENKVLFTGDVVFNQGIGRTDLPGGSGEELKKSIKRISSLEVEHLLSGHGDILSGGERVKSNFKFIEDYWFAYL